MWTWWHVFLTWIHTKLLSKSQLFTWAQVWCSCQAKSPLCPFWEITHAASLLETFHTLPPSPLSSAPAPLIVVAYRSRGRHTWEIAHTVSWSNWFKFTNNLYQYYTTTLWVFHCLLLTCFQFCDTAVIRHYHNINREFCFDSHTDGELLRGGVFTVCGGRWHLGVD